MSATANVPRLVNCLDKGEGGFAPVSTDVLSLGSGPVFGQETQSSQEGRGVVFVEAWTEWDG